MRLIELTLTNFQGIRAMQIGFGGKSASIYGDNATGKTTVYNAITWLLFDRPGNGAKSYTPKTKGPNGDLHYLEHSAEATFLDGDRLLVLKKTFREVYKKKRGSATEEFDGHTVDYYVDGVPVKEKEYTATVLAACGGDAEIPKLLTMPDYFSEVIPWEARRRILLAVCGDVTDEDVIDSDPELRDLRAVLLMPGSHDRYYTVDEYKKIAAARRAEINRSLNEIPVRIAEAERAIPEVGAISREALDLTLDNLRDERSRCLIEKEGLSVAGAVELELRKRLAEVECVLAEHRSRHICDSAHLNDALDGEIRAAKATLAETELEIGKSRNDALLAKRELERLKSLREDLLDEYDAVADKCFDEKSGVCPTCRRPLPEEDVEQMREQFNLRRSRRLEEINARGKREASRSMIDEAERTLAEITARLDELPGRRDEIAEAIRALEGRRIAATPFEETPAYRECTEEIGALKARLEDERGTADVAIKEIDDKLFAIDTEIRERSAEAALFDVRDAQQYRIAELEVQEHELAAAFEETERGLYLCERFIRAKVSALTERVGAHFKSVRFRLFREQINGGLAEDCEVMIPAEDGRMVPYSFANSAARINAGLEIIDVLSRFYGVELPVVVDNAESVTRLADVGTQVIRLVVSEGDSTLRVETNEKEM